MRQYQISVNINGRFLFLTDWDSDKERVMLAYDMLNENPEFKVVMYSRETSMRIESMRIERES